MNEMILADFIQRALVEDLGNGDHTSLACIPAEAKGRARLLVKDEGILAGVAVAEAIFHTLDPELKMETLLHDGDKITRGDVAFQVEGSSRSLLAAERTVLNTLQRMSGIATTTAEYVAALHGLPTQLLDTRKTTPTLRFLEKEAVRIGGGTNYRWGLYDRIMIKDNHVDFAGGIAKALTRVKTYLQEQHLDLAITLEVRNLEELEQALAIGGMQRIMLDNFTPTRLATAITTISRAYETEASGGIKLNTLREFAETGVDFISVGALTHSFRSLDLSFKGY